MSGPKPLLDSTKLNLERVHFLLVDDNQQALDILAQVMAGLGVRNMIKCTTVEEAKKHLSKSTIDFVVTDAHMPVESGYELVDWIRHEPNHPNKYVPAVIVTGHTPRRDVLKGRDCGAHFIVAKPLTPGVLLERIYWVASDDRMFIECDAYVGPDRRFKRLGPPPGMDGRRSDDTTGDLGDPSEPNMSQEDINALMKPAKVSL